jgi:hypothetical protein
MKGLKNVKGQRAPMCHFVPAVPLGNGDGPLAQGHLVRATDTEFEREGEWLVRCYGNVR